MKGFPHIWREDERLGPCITTLKQCYTLDDMFPQGMIHCNTMTRALRFNNMKALTCLSDHPPCPRTIVVHFLDAPLDISGVVGSIRLPILAVRAPYGQAIAPAGVEIPGVEGLESELRFEGHDTRVICNSV